MMLSIVPIPLCENYLEPDHKVTTIWGGQSFEFVHVLGDIGWIYSMQAWHKAVLTGVKRHILHSNLDLSGATLPTRNDESWSNPLFVVANPPICDTCNQNSHSGIGDDEHKKKSKWRSKIVLDIKLFWLHTKCFHCTFYPCHPWNIHLGLLWPQGATQTTLHCQRIMIVFDLMNINVFKLNSCKIIFKFFF